jgi:hypothetical protein
VIKWFKKNWYKLAAGMFIGCVLFTFIGLFNWAFMFLSTYYHYVVPLVLLPACIGMGIQMCWKDKERNNET